MNKGMLIVLIWMLYSYSAISQNDKGYNYESITNFYKQNDSLSTYSYHTFHSSTILSLTNDGEFYFEVQLDVTQRFACGKFVISDDTLFTELNSTETKNKISEYRDDKHNHIYRYIPIKNFNNLIFTFKSDSLFLNNITKDRQRFMKLKK